MNICIMTDFFKILFHLKTRQTVLIENQSLHLLPVIGRHKKKKKSALNIAYLSKQIHEISTSCSHTALRPLDSPRS